MVTQTFCDEYGRMTRRDFLMNGLNASAGLFWGGMITPMAAHLPKIALADPHVGPRGDTLVCIFLRGGADGLNVVVPFGDEAYYGQRSELAINRPDQGAAEERSINLDGFFALHPALAPIKPLYDAGALAFVQATGSPDESRSHFEAMDLMERGAVPGAYTGWLARHLATLDTGNSSALRAIAINDRLPLSLAGVDKGTALRSIESYQLGMGMRDVSGFESLLKTTYAGGDPADLLRSAAQQTFDAIELMHMVGAGPGGVTQGGRGRYRAQPFGQALQTVARLIKEEIGVEVASVDLGGWDTHAQQGGAQGQMANLLTELAEGLAGFYEMLGEDSENVTVIVMSEFGRRVRENASRGTDHGHGNMMMVLGGGVQGGKVYADWPGLATEQLVGPGDLDITTDYRDILGEILGKRLNNPLVGEVFPAYTVTETGIVAPRTAA